MSKRSMAWLSLLAIALCTLVISTRVAGPPRTNQDRVRALSEDFACPMCDGQSVAESNAVVAQEVRRDIRRRVDAGETDDDITQALVGSYGDSIDLRPTSGGVIGLIWIVPVVVMVFGFASLATVLQRWRSAQVHTASADDVALVDELRRERP